MKCAALWLGFLAASVFSAGAQFSVEVSQDQDQFLQGEALRTTVRVINRSGQTLHLGAEEDWLVFSMEDEHGAVVPKLSEAPVVQAFDLASSKAAVKKVDLQPCFRFPRSGRYRVVATVRVPGWEQEIASPPCFFNIIEGTTLWEQEFGVPLAEGITNKAPEVRKYMLQQANYIKGQLRLYMRLIDSTGRNLRVSSIGLLLSFSHPEPRLDKNSNLHVLYQNGPQTFSYTRFSPDGELLVRQTYDFGPARPRLRLDDAGTVTVNGGVRHVMPDDVPAAKSSLPEDSPAPLMPPPLDESKSNKGS
jgi:hypothetical protein